MAKKPLPSPEVLRQLLRYEPETGKLFWKERSPKWFKDGQKSASHNAAVWNVKYSHKEAFTAIASHGYRTGAIFDRKYLAHRVAWAIETGMWPREEIDHIDGDRLNNTFGNLREATSSDNSRNLKRFSNNTSGVTGVMWDKVKSKWVAQIYLGQGKTKWLGSFSSVEEAAAARAAANIKFGYHENHGRD